MQTPFIEPGSPWENGYVKSFNDKLRHELLNGELFDTRTEARILIAQWRGMTRNWNDRGEAVPSRSLARAFRPAPRTR